MAIWEKTIPTKQEVSELHKCLRSDVLIGAFIGNYDKGGHKVSLNLLAYPGDDKWGDKPLKQHLSRCSTPAMYWKSIRAITKQNSPAKWPGCFFIIKLRWTKLINKS